MRPSFLPWGSRIQNPAGAAAIDVAGDVDLHAVGHAGVARCHVERAMRAPRAMLPSARTSKARMCLRSESLM